MYCTSSKSFVRCEPTKALYSVRQGLCFCVLYEPQELCAVRAYKGRVLLCTVRAPRALRGASLPKLCASVCCTSPTSFSVRAYKDFIPCAPGLCFCVLYEPHGLCAVRAYKGFIQCAGARPSSFALSAYVLVRSYEQMSSCTRTCTYVLYELTRYLLFSTGTCIPVCRGTKHSRATSTPACVLRTPAVKNYIIGTVVKTSYIYSIRSILLFPNTELNRVLILCVCLYNLLERQQMKFCCYVGVVSIPTTPVHAACVLLMCKAGSYFHLRSLLSRCVRSIWPRTDLSHRFGSACQICKPAFNFKFRVLLRKENRNQPHLARRRDCSEQGRPSSTRVAVVRVRGIVARVLPEHAVFCLLRCWRCGWLLRLLLLRTG